MRSISAWLMGTKPSDVPARAQFRAYRSAPSPLKLSIVASRSLGGASLRQPEVPLGLLVPSPRRFAITLPLGHL
ncbi:hypothetical protein Pflav_086930 [Phytohabitans flavus]|uniref:Uncharacterized protein n=1 Tax=Phytohabitans flavus TaxID=1076124 RepID=A0A6F8Y8D3_9ACTN|nr:hypothetical protein Pflav_086930 [Phytohabitans flavus]